jgi:hypothetical protein
MSSFIDIMRGEDAIHCARGGDHKVHPEVCRWHIREKDAECLEIGCERYSSGQGEKVEPEANLEPFKAICAECDKYIPVNEMGYDPGRPEVVCRECGGGWWKKCNVWDFIVKGEG